MTNEEANEILRDDEAGKHWTELGYADVDEYNRDWEKAWQMALKALEAHEGRWIFKKINWGYPECSECGHVFDFGASTENFINEANYCPNCGAKMRREEDDERRGN